MSDIKFIDNDISQLELALKKGYEEIMGVTVKDGDPVNDFISWVTYILLSLIHISEPTRPY